MNVLVIDGQGGGLGRQFILALRALCPGADITAVGTNALASGAMLKAGADRAATGENAVIVNCRYADIIVGPVGIVIADSIWGEVTPAMALAVGQSPGETYSDPRQPLRQCDCGGVRYSHVQAGSKRGRGRRRTAPLSTPPQTAQFIFICDQEDAASP